VPGYSPPCNLRRSLPGRTTASTGSGNSDAQHRELCAYCGDG
jgi:hypothetical protein